MILTKITLEVTFSFFPPLDVLGLSFTTLAVNIAKLPELLLRFESRGRT